MAKQTTQGTLVIDNFAGSMTGFLDGDINSGRSYVQTCSGQNPFIKPGNLTWGENATQIDSAGSIITDMVVAAKERVESGILYVYGIGHTGRVYKIQVNDPTTYNPDYDTPSLLTTITINSPTFKRGGFIDFYGATEQIIIGHDMGATKLNFDGTGEAFIGILGSWTQDVPRPIKQFLGKLYFGNGANLAELDTTNTITTYAKISPGFPSNTQVRDIDLSIDGNYVEIVSSTLPLYDITSVTQETSSTANAGSFIFKWNGTDTGTTASTSFPSFSLGANTLFQNYQYTFGTDQYGTAVYSPNEKILFVPEGPSPLPNAITSTGNQLLWMTPIYFNGVLEADLLCWGSADFEIGHPLGWWDLFFINAKAPETDIVRMPLLLPVSNAGFGSSSNNYPNNQFGVSKFYFSTMETSSGPTVAYRFYRWRSNSVVAVANEDAITGGVYQTQSQFFSKKVKATQVRIYGEPWVANNSFTIDLIGSNGGPITGGSRTFTAATNTTGIALENEIIIGDDFAWYTPSIAPTYTIGANITNEGSANHTINKIEIDWVQAGQ